MGVLWVGCGAEGALFGFAFFCGFVIVFLALVILFFQSVECVLRLFSAIVGYLADEQPKLVHNVFQISHVFNDIFHFSFQVIDLAFDFRVCILLIHRSGIW